MEQQRPDGGWAANHNLDTDAYATGESLYALRESGTIPVTDAVYQRGVTFLLNTQFEDGSWYVRSAPKIIGDTSSPAAFGGGHPGYLMDSHIRTRTVNRTALHGRGRRL